MSPNPNLFYVFVDQAVFLDGGVTFNLILRGKKN